MYCTSYKKVFFFKKTLSLNTLHSFNFCWINGDLHLGTDSFAYIIAFSSEIVEKI